MITYRMKTTGQLVTEKEYRAMFPSISFPAILAPADADPILESATPTTDSTHFAVRSGVKQDALLNWVWDWDIVPKTDSQILAEFKATVPNSVTMLQARKAMSRTTTGGGQNMLEAVTAALAALPGQPGVEARIEWEYSQEVQRAWPLVAMIGSALGFTERALDDLFIFAKTL